MTALTPARILRPALGGLALVMAACTTVTTPPVAKVAPVAPILPAPIAVAPAPAPSISPVPSAPAPLGPTAGASLPPPSVPMPAVAPAPAEADADPVFGLGKLHHFEFALTTAEWAVLQTSSARGGSGTGGTDYTQADGRVIHTGSGFSGYFPWAHANVRIAGEEFGNVGLRYRGNYSFTSSSAAIPLRANFKLKLDTYGTKGAWRGVKTLNFNAGVLDNTLTREAISFALFREAGVPASRTAYAELSFTVPGIYANIRSGGYYVMIEDINKTFLKRALPPGDGLVMKPEGLSGGIQSQGSVWSSYVSRFRPDRDATPYEQQRVMEFAQLISQTDVALFRAKVGTYLDVDEFLRFIAVNAFIENWDSYIGGGHNYYFYLDPSDDKFRFLPWDEDLAMGTRGGMGGGGFNMLTPYRNNQPLIYWLLDDPAVMARYRAVLQALSAGAFSRANIDKLCDTVEATLGTRGAAPRAYLQSRASQLAQQIAAWEKPDAAP